MDTAQFAIAAVINITIMAGLVFLEYLALKRNPGLRSRKWLRRGVWFVTLVGLSGVAVYYGKGDWFTWGVTAAFFVIAKLIGGGSEKVDNGRKPALGEGKENGKWKWEKAVQETTRQH